MLPGIVVAGFCLLVLLVLLVCLFTPSVYSHAKPVTKKKVIELSCDGWLAQKLLANNWGASTIPLPFLVLILYWVSDSATVFPDYSCRVHEMVHVRQDQGNFCFLVSWVKYFYELISKRIKTDSWMQAYRQNKYEAEAYKVEDDVVTGVVPCPDWAK